MKKKITVQGSVAPGFESIKRLFETEMKSKAEHGAQLCVYYKGVKIVDLWAARDHQSTLHADSLVNVFSSGKSLEAIAIASLVDKGLLRYQDTIAQHWPEFATNGKEQITVADLMRHEAGLENFRHTFDPEDLLRENIKQNRVGRVIESLQPRMPKDVRKRRNYHAMTRGWIVNELFRRVDPQGRTLGEYLEQDIAQPLAADVHVGVSPDDLARRAPVKGLDLGYYIKESLKPRFAGRKVELSAVQLAAIYSPIVKSIIKSRVKKRKKSRQMKPSQVPANRSARGPFEDLSFEKDREKMVEFFNQPIIAQGESASFNAHCSARGLAKVAAMMAAHGRFQGRTYLGETAWQALHANPETKSLGGTVTTHFTQGGLNLFTMRGSMRNRRDKALNKGREGFYGWMGLGGSIFQWNPDYEIGFAFVPTSMHIIDVFNERGKVYQREVLRCVRSLQRQQQVKYVPLTP